MTSKTAAAPRRRRQAGLATVVLVTLAVLGFASSQALAGSSVEAQVGTGAASVAAVTTTAPDPDPLPDPKPDPKPVRRTKAKAPPPPPPPAPQTQARQQSTTPPPVPPPARTEPQDVAKPQAVAKPKVAATKPTRRARPRPVRKPRVKRPEPRKHAAAQQPTRTLPIETDDASLAEAPALVIPADPDPPTVPPFVLPIIGLGLLLVGGSSVSPRRIPWPALAAPLEAHRAELAVAGAGAIAFALLWLNAAVFF